MHGSIVAVALGATLLVSPLSRSGPFERLWQLLAGWGAPAARSATLHKEGIGADPNGQSTSPQPSTTEAGVGADPNGSTTEEGPGMDPNGTP